MFIMSATLATNDGEGDADDGAGDVDVHYLCLLQPQRRVRTLREDVNF